MKVQAEILNVIYYNDKKTNEPKTVIHYRLLDRQYLVHSEKMVGFSEMSEYINGHGLKDIIKEEMIGVGCEIEYMTKPSENNPRFTLRIIKSIKVGSSVINLA